MTAADRDPLAEVERRIRLNMAFPQSVDGLSVALRCIEAVRAERGAGVALTGGRAVVLTYHPRFDSGREIAPTDVELTIGGHRYVVHGPEKPPSMCDGTADCRAVDIHMLCCPSPIRGLPDSYEPRLCDAGPDDGEEPE